MSISLSNWISSVWRTWCVIFTFLLFIIKSVIVYVPYLPNTLAFRAAWGACALFRASNGRAWCLVLSHSFWLKILIFIIMMDALCCFFNYYVSLRRRAGITKTRFFFIPLNHERFGRTCFWNNFYLTWLTTILEH